MIFPIEGLAELYKEESGYMDPVYDDVCEALRPDESPSRNLRGQGSFDIETLRKFYIFKGAGNALIALERELLPSGNRDNIDIKCKELGKSLRGINNDIGNVKEWPIAYTTDDKKIPGMGIRLLAALVHFAHPDKVGMFDTRTATALDKLVGAKIGKISGKPSISKFAGIMTKYIKGLNALKKSLSSDICYRELDKALFMCGGKKKCAPKQRCGKCPVLRQEA